MNTLNKILKFSYLVNLKSITIEDIVQWSSDRNFEMLLFASLKGSHEIRIKSINHLGRKCKDRKVRNALISFMDDPLLSIATHASNTLQSHMLIRELEVDKGFNEAIERLNERIEHRDNMASYFSSANSTSKPLRSSRKDMKRLEAIRKALRKQIR